MGTMSSSSPSSSALHRVSGRIGGIAESATLTVDAKAKALKAAGRPVIGFGAGEPDFPTPDYIVEAAVEACRDPKNHRYTPAGGLPELKAGDRREDAAATPATSWSRPRCWSPTAASRRSTQAFATLLDPGDEVILPAPYWTTYPEAIRLAGGVPVEVLADETQDYKVTVEQLEAARTDRTKVLLFCSPSNPTGAVYTAEEIEAIGRWVVEHGLWVVTDEIYEHLVYDGARDRLAAGAGARSSPTRCVVVNGVAKTYAMTGWRVGWMIGPKDVIKAATNLQSHADVQRRQRLPAGRDRRGLRRPDRGRGDARGVRPAPQDDRVDAERDRRRRSARSPTGAFYAYPSVKGAARPRDRRASPRRRRPSWPS